MKAEPETFANLPWRRCYLLFEKVSKALYNYYGVFEAALLVWSVVDCKSGQEQSLWIACNGDLDESKFGLGYWKANWPLFLSTNVKKGIYEHIYT